ncbi:uncharacterized protein LOC135388087 isoform X2 [Ornithodoros turicata]|uniref:uncharacterized protein LOC135388087 isoform X2 n=1 Tax=Ornithodoros turicata TaxID=34597 RepID=UPI003139DFF9
MARIRAKPKTPSVVCVKAVRKNSDGSVQKGWTLQCQPSRQYRKNRKKVPSSVYSPAISGARRRIGSTFSKLLWSQYEDYQASLQRTVLPALKDKEAHDVEFVTLCKMRKGAVKYTLHDFLHQPLERLLQYDQYLAQLSSATPNHHPDYSDLCKAAQKARSMVRRGDPGKEETDLDRIQDLFPSDNLRLNERDPLSPRKGLLRSKSVAASKLHRALSGKSKSATDILSPTKENGGFFQDGGRNNNWTRCFIMDGPAQFSIGLQNQERHLFLLSDVLLIAKPKSSGNYKLKDKVRTCELWLSNCLSDVSESTRSSDTSFVIGWPTTNVVVTFSSSATRDLWHNQFTQLISEAKEKEGRQLTSLQVSYWDPVSQRDYLQTIKISNTHTTKDCIYLCTQKIDGAFSADEFQMWVKTGKEESPYPLIGHEYPYCIKMNFVRDLLQNSNIDLSSLGDVITDCKCAFILRRNYHKITINNVEKQKKVRRPTIINWPFKKQPSKQSSTDSGTVSPVVGSLFGQELSKVSPSGTVPRPVMALLKQLFLRGPFTYGIFRKSGNVRAKRELQSRLEEDPDYTLSDVPIHVVAATFKEFLGCLPDCLLQRSLYTEWLKVLQVEPEWKKRDYIISLLKKLPPANVELLRHFLCVLWHISRRSSENKMPSSNLAVCIGPSLLSPKFVDSYHSPTLQSEISEQVPHLVEYLIEHSVDIFGKEFLQLFGEVPQKDPSRQDSGAEESDSPHSLQENGGAFRRDDSSIDSLERALMDDSSPKLPNRTKVSLTNLSRDSGLTLSDTQLYTPEDDVEMDANTSLQGMTKSVPHLDIVGVGELHCARKSSNQQMLDHSDLAGMESMYSRGNGRSCNDVVRRRKCGADNPKSCRPQNVSATPGVYTRFSPVSRDARSQQLQYSKSCNYRDSDVVESDDLTTNDTLVRWRKHRGRQQRGQVMSAIEISHSHSSLIRSASEESLLQKYICEDVSKRRPQHSKGMAPKPPMEVYSNNGFNCDRAMPDRHAVWFANHNRTVDWKRSQSTSKIDEIDNVHEAPPLSCAPSQSTFSGNRIPVGAQEQASRTGVVHTPPRVNSVCSSASDTSQRSHRSHDSNSSCLSGRSRGSCQSRRTPVSSTSPDIAPIHRSPLHKPAEPPSYREAMTRRSLLHRSQTLPQAEDGAADTREQTPLGVKARQLYESSLKQYNQQLEEGSETHHAILVKVDSSDEGIAESPPPPLPPKPHSNVHRTVSEGTGVRLRHHPPVHVKDSQLVNRGKCVVVSSFHDRCQNQALYDFPKEISWSVAQLRNFFSNQSAPVVERIEEQREEGLSERRSPVHDIVSTIRGEESYV